MAFNIVDKAFNNVGIGSAVRGNSTNLAGTGRRQLSCPPVKIIVVDHWLPPGFGATSKHHNDLEKMLGIKPHWKEAEAQYNRDLPKLRQLFPMIR